MLLDVRYPEACFGVVHFVQMIRMELMMRSDISSGIRRFLHCIALFSLPLLTSCAGDGQDTITLPERVNDNDVTHQISSNTAPDPISFANFSNVSTLKLNGNASVMGSSSVLCLTPATSGQSGSIFSLSKIALKDNNSTQNVSFSTSFSFQISNTSSFGDNDGGGADGLTFVIQPNANDVGTSGGGLGYSGINRSIGVEFDTYNNGSDDGNDGNHIGIDLNGSVKSVAQFNVATRMNNGLVWYAWVDYNGSTDVLDVRLAQTKVRPTAATLSYTLNLSSILGQDSAFVGFTASTGAGYETHDILSWHFTGSYNPYGASR